MRSNSTNATLDEPIYSERRFIRTPNGKVTYERRIDFDAAAGVPFSISLALMLLKAPQSLHCRLGELQATRQRELGFNAFLKGADGLLANPHLRGNRDSGMSLTDEA